MAAYPTTLPAPNGFIQRTVKKHYKGESEANYTMSRSKATLGKKEFELSYLKLTDAEMVILDDHFDSDSGGSFSFTVPKTGGATYTVIYIDEDLEFDWASQFQDSRWKATVNLREV